MNSNDTHMIQLPKRENFNQILDNKQVDLFYLTNDKIEVAITNYGARIVSIIVEDKNGYKTDVVVGFDSLDGYLKSDEKYHGALVGRFANRIAKGRFTLEGRTYTLATNNGVNHLHGGNKGFQDSVWDIAAVNKNSLSLIYHSIDGEEGYPGNLELKVTYTLTGNDLSIDFEAVSDDTTIINVTNHAFFNLNGQGSGTILDHLLTINADHYTPIDETSIPFGEIAKVEGTPFDFRKPTTIGARIKEDHLQLKNGQGYDHNFVLNQKNKDLIAAAKALGNKSGITLEVLTTEPGMQLYSGNFMKGTNTIKYGLKDELNSAFCLETQHFPDSPNKPHFPTTTLRKGEQFSSKTIFRFGVL